MAYRILTLDLTIISASDLNKVNLISKMDPYVVVYLQGGSTTNKTKQKTPVDHNGDTNPTWNHHIKLTFNESEAKSSHHRLSIVFQILCNRNLGDKEIGEVHVPISDLMDGGDSKAARFVSYQIRKPSGKPKGVLNFSYTIGDYVNASSTVKDQIPAPLTAYPVAGPSSAAVYPPPSAPPAFGYPPPPPPPQPYAYPTPQTAYPTPQTGYAAQTGYPAQGGYGYGPGYGYPYQGPIVQPKPKKNNTGLGLGAGLLGGALAGFLVGDLVSDFTNDGYGYDQGYYDPGGFDGSGFDMGGFGF